MINTERQKRMLAYRREERDFIRQGWERVGEGGGRLWELYRGWRIDQRIVDVRIAMDGKSLWIKTQPVAEWPGEREIAAIYRHIPTPPHTGKE